MPIYQYKYGDCGQISEFLQGSSRSTQRNWVHCGSGKLQKQLSTFVLLGKEGESKRCYGCSDSNCPHGGH